MNSKLRELVDAVNGSSDYEIKYVISWGYCGSVDSVLYDSYRSASRNLDKENSVLPVIVELDEEDKQKRKRKLAKKCSKSTKL